MKDESENAAAALIHPSSFNIHPSRTRYRVMAFICVLSFLTYFDRQGITQVQGAFSGTWASPIPRWG